jgi:hypothetical protein
VSKNERMSASSIQFTFVLVIPTKSASIASCVAVENRAIGYPLPKWEIR